MPVRFAYSVNGENYVGAYDSRAAALAAGIDAARDPLGLIDPQTIFVGQRVEADPHTAGHARTILREMAWQAHDDVGAPARSYLDRLSDDQIRDLDGAVERVLLDWLRRNDLLPTYFKVEAISEHPIPAPSLRRAASRNGDDREVHDLGTTPDLR